MSTVVDQRFMAIALALAQRGLGTVWPNPAVGCVIVRDGMVVGRGWTQPGGRPHAETEALTRAGTSARGATAYVTLEPCNHYGKTPPCTEALIDAGLKTGLARDVAETLAVQTVLGSVKLLLENKEHPAVLRAKVTSPGGTTIAGLHVLEKNGFRGIIMDAVEAAANRATELGRQ